MDLSLGILIKISSNYKFFNSLDAITRTLTWRDGEFDFTVC